MNRYSIVWKSKGEWLVVDNLLSIPTVICTCPNGEYAERVLKALRAIDGNEYKQGYDDAMDAMQRD